MNLNTKEIRETGAKPFIYNCRQCEETRGDGEIKYIETLDPTTGKWMT
jgi:hypothetical protein